MVKNPGLTCKTDKQVPKTGKQVLLPITITNYYLEKRDENAAKKHIPAPLTGCPAPVPPH